VLLLIFFLIVFRPASRRQLKALRKESTPGELLMQVGGILALVAHVTCLDLLRAVFRILSRIRICMFLSLVNPDP
jgi:hypothetical protein